MEGESIPCETLAQDRQHAFGVDDVVERHQRVIGEPDKSARPSETRLHLGLEPLVRYRAPNKDAWPRARSAKCGAPGEPTVLAGSRTNRTESLVHRFLPAPLSRRVAPPCPRRSARPDRTALSRNRPLGSAEVIHPFHPLRGQ